MSRKHPGRPKNTEPNSPCKYTSCEKPSVAKGFCQTHYVYLRRGIISETGERLRQPLRVSKYDQTAECLVEGCSDRPRSRGMCNKHMLQREAGIIDAAGKQLRELQVRPRADRWIGQDGYVLVQAPPGHPFARADGSILEHRLVMEKHLGVHLDPDEFLVHHKFGNRSDNVPERLEVLSAHAKRGEGHPPGSEIPPQVAVQILLQQPVLPDGLRQWLTHYKIWCSPTSA